MDERLKLTEEKKKQLLFRVEQALEEDVLNLLDWMTIYDILLEAFERRSAEVQEEYMIESLKEGDEEC